jgi:predicted O-methyltransferase YrrM
MAASEEMCHFLASACESLRPSTILDLGSGISSFVLRHFDVEVWSVDDDKEWLDKTRGFLTQEGVSTENVIHLDDFDWSKRFDLVFHDFGHMEVREQFLSQAVASTEQGGLLVLDDVHKLHYRVVVQREITQPSFSLRKWTEDEYGRFGMAVLP